MSFPAKYNGWCPGCGTKIRVGDEVDYAGSKVVHEGCGIGRDATDWPPADRDDDDDREPQPVITGRRNHQKLCSQCNTVHTGECW